MLKSYLKTAWRKLLKNKTTSIINIAGLSLSVAFCLMLFFYIRHEQSYDQFHAKKNSLYRLEMTSLWDFGEKDTQKGIFSFFTKGDGIENDVVMPVTVAPDMVNTFADIKSVTRFKDEGSQLIKAGNTVFKQEHIVFADSNFFTNFSFHLIKGDPRTVLASVKNVVLSKSAALKYFGKSDPIGKTIEFVTENNRLYTVAGVADDAPGNSSISFGLVVPVLSDPDYAENLAERFNHSTHLCMVELAPGVTAAQFEPKLNQWAKTYFSDYFKYFQKADLTKFHLYLRPLADCHYNISTPWGHYTNAKNIYQLAILAVIILLIASLNYVLLTVASSASRTQEVGIRKVMGAGKKAVIMQFWAETQVLAMFSVITGFVLAWLFLPVFNAATQTQFSFADFPFWQVLATLMALGFLLGVLAGYYPAVLIARIKPLGVIKSFQTFKLKPRFSKILVAVQFTACIVLMLVVFVINRQMHYISNKNLGFDKEQVLVVTNPVWDDGFTTRVRARLAVFAQSQPSILMFSGMNGSLDGSYNTNGFKLNGQQMWLKQFTVDYDYFKMLNIQFLQGRPFLRSMASDTSRKIRPCVVNETLFNLLGTSAKMGVYNEAIRGTIIGVVKDYHFETLSKKIEPEQHVLAGTYVSNFMFKVRAGQMPQTIAAVKKEWKNITNDYPFEYTFLDETVAAMYAPEMRWQNIFEASCFFTVFIACMGLFGLSAINAANRTKEIGIRKVLGATVKDVVSALSSSFITMIIVSFIIASPIAWWIMNNWLQDYAYRINITWWMFALTGAVVLLIAIGTVSYHAVKAAVANPVKALRDE